MEPTTNPPQEVQQPVSQTPVASNGGKSKLPLIISLVVLFIVLGVGGIYAWRIWSSLGQLPPKQAACTLEAKVCPDGSSVGWVGPTCEFAPCPLIASPSAKLDDTAGWKTYVNPTYHYEIKYPPTWVLLAPTEGKSEITVMTSIRENFEVYPLHNIDIQSFSGDSKASLLRFKNSATTWKWDNTPKQSDFKLGTLQGWIIEGLINPSGKEAYWYKYILLPADGVLYQITWDDTSDRVFEATFNTILSTFKFTDQTSSSAMTTYHNKELGFTLSYPKVLISEDTGDILTLFQSEAQKQSFDSCIKLGGGMCALYKFNISAVSKGNLENLSGGVSFKPVTLGSFKAWQSDTILGDGLIRTITILHNNMYYYITGNVFKDDVNSVEQNAVMFNEIVGTIKFDSK